MKILMAHGRYALRGGEDQVFETELRLLREHGHEVFSYECSNERIHGLRVLTTGAQTIWNQGEYLRVRQRIRETGSQLVAVHNFFPLLSPSIFHAALAENVPSVLTLHNFRLICPAATLLRDGEVCRDCVGRTVPLPAIQHACYRSSRILSTAVAAMNATHRVLGTWDKVVTRFIALTEEMKEEYVKGGFEAGRILVKPNSTEVYPVGLGEQNSFLFVGRLSKEKGVSVLLDAWVRAKTQGELWIAGTGPEEVALKQQAASLSNVHFLGQQTREAVQERMGNAKALVVPSIWPETFGLTVIEAFCKGTPVIATDLGALRSLVSPGRSGYLFPRGDVARLAALLDDSCDYKALRAGARAEYEQRFTPEHNYKRLIEIYNEALRAPASRQNAKTVPGQPA